MYLSALFARIYAYEHTEPMHSKEIDFNGAAIYYIKYTI